MKKNYAFKKKSAHNVYLFTIKEYLFKITYDNYHTTAIRLITTNGYFWVVTKTVICMKYLFAVLTILFINICFTSVFAQNIPVYFELGTTQESIQSSAEKVKNALTTDGFKIIGAYNPGNQENLYVICYTRTDLEKIALDFEDRGALGATLKIGLKNEDGTVKVSMLNPIYLFNAYFNKNIEKHEAELQKISGQAIAAASVFGQDIKPFGGELSKEKLHKYHYKMMMPYFKDAEVIAKFSSFNEGIKTIQENLEAGTGNTKKVYELIYNDKKTAVFGVALLNEKDGESHFLPIIGDSHLAAMPYEIILQGTTASTLPGRYRIALNWPELTMGTFMKIMSTPGDIKKTMEKVTQ